jgi:hypothetical protein
MEKEKKGVSMKRLALWMLTAAVCVSLAACASAPAQDTGAATQDNAAQGTDAAQDSAASASDVDGAAQDAEAETLTDAEAAYQEKIDGLEAADGGEIHWAVFQCGAGEKILMVASAVYADGEAMEADVYQYADGEVKFIASVASTGTAYPLAHTPDAVLFGGNHTSGKLSVQGGAGELRQIKDMNIEGRAPVLEVYDMSGGEAALKSSEELSAEDADAMDFYTGAFADGTAEIIAFQ